MSGSCRPALGKAKAQRSDGSLDAALRWKLVFSTYTAVRLWVKHTFKVGFGKPFFLTGAFHRAAERF